MYEYSYTNVNLTECWLSCCMSLAIIENAATNNKSNNLTLNFHESRL